MSPTEIVIIMQGSLTVLALAYKVGFDRSKFSEMQDDVKDLRRALDVVSAQLTRLEVFVTNGVDAKGGGLAAKFITRREYEAGAHEPGKG